MRQFFIAMFGSIVGFFIALILLFVFLAMLVGAIAGSVSSGSDKSVTKDATVLTLDLRRGFLDHGGENSLFGSSPSIVTTVRALSRAKSDKKIKGLFVRANSWGMSPAKAEELHLAIEDFQTSGKFVIAHAQGFEGTSLSSYLSISGADEIWLQDTTGFALSGYRAEIEFLGGVFEKFDAQPEFIQFHEYKNAANTYTQKSLTEPHREAMTSLLQSIMDTAVSNIAADREISESEFLEFLDNAPHSAEAAKERGFVNKLGHYIDALEYVKEKAGGDDTAFQSVTDYGTGFNTGPVIAFIGGQGAVVEGSPSDGSNPFAGGKMSMGGDTLSEALIKASEDEDVKAIVFRVNSPGGSATASDQIWDAVNRAKDAGKPVVISMGQYAASGGYYVAANADSIVAMPTTITGSIGVLGGKVVLRDTLAKIGYNIEAIELGGDYGSAYSAFEPWNQANREAYRQSMENIYVDFTSRVASGRDLPIERVREIAKGRVWTGAQAKEIGLVDELGGFMKALEIAKELAEIDAETDVRIKKFPREKTSQEQLMELFNVTADAAVSLDELRVLTQSPEFKALIAARSDLESLHQMRLKASVPEIK